MLNLQDKTELVIREHSPFNDYPNIVTSQIKNKCYQIISYESYYKNRCRKHGEMPWVNSTNENQKCTQWVGILVLWFIGVHQQDKSRRKAITAKDIGWKDTNVQSCICSENFMLSGLLDGRRGERRGWRWHQSWIVLGPECNGQD